MKSFLVGIKKITPNWGKICPLDKADFSMEFYTDKEDATSEMYYNLYVFLPDVIYKGFVNDSDIHYNYPNTETIKDRYDLLLYQVLCTKLSLSNMKPLENVKNFLLIADFLSDIQDSKTVLEDLKL